MLSRPQSQTLWKNVFLSDVPNTVVDWCGFCNWKSKKTIYSIYIYIYIRKSEYLKYASVKQSRKPRCCAGFIYGSIHWVARSGITNKAHDMAWLGTTLYGHPPFFLWLWCIKRGPTHISTSILTFFGSIRKKTQRIGTTNSIHRIFPRLRQPHPCPTRSPWWCLLHVSLHRSESLAPGTTHDMVVPLHP